MAVFAPTGKPETSPSIKAVEHEPFTLNTGFIKPPNILPKISARPKETANDEKTKKGNKVGIITFIHKLNASFEAPNASVGDATRPTRPATEIKMKIYFLKKATP